MKAKNYEDHFVPYYECGAIKIDDDGNIWRVKRKVWHRTSGRKWWVDVKPHKLGLPRNDYLRSALNIAGKIRQAENHRIVYRCLIGPIPSDREVNHIDGNKQNNRLSNLELVTHSGNLMHAARHGNCGGRQGVKPIDVLYIRWAAQQGIGKRLLAEFFKANRSVIQAIAFGRTWKSLNAVISRFLPGETPYEPKGRMARQKGLTSDDFRNLVGIA